MFIAIDDERLEVQHTQFLDVFIEDKLSWDKHIDDCMKKVASGIYGMNMTKHLLS